MRGASSGDWRDLTILVTALTMAGILSGLVGAYTYVFVGLAVPTCVVAFRDSRFACVMVAITSPLVAVGAVRIGFHLVPCYPVIVAGLAGATRRREWHGLAWRLTDGLAVAFGLVALTVSAATLGTTPKVDIPGAVGVNGRMLRSPAQLAALLLMLGLYALLRMSIRDRESLRAVARALLAAWVAVALYAAYQFIARSAMLPYAYLNDRRTLSELPIGRMSVRINGTLPEASPLAAFSFAAIACGVATLLRGQSGARLMRPRAASVLTLAGFGILLASLSKAALVSAVLVLPALITRGRTWSTKGRVAATLMVAGVCGIVAVGLALRSPGIQLSSVVNSELYVREGYWLAALHIGAAHPFGVGVGNYTFYYPLYAPVSTSYEFLNGITDAHSWYLEAFAETGVVGGLLFLAFTLSVAISGLGISQRRSRPGDELVLAFGVAWTACALMHTTYSYFYYPFEWVFAGIVCAGRSISIRESALTEAEPPKEGEVDALLHAHELTTMKT